MPATLKFIEASRCTIHSSVSISHVIRVLPLALQIGLEVAFLVVYCILSIWCEGLAFISGRFWILQPFAGAIHCILLLAIVFVGIAYIGVLTGSSLQRAPLRLNSHRRKDSRREKHKYLHNAGMCVDGDRLRAEATFTIREPGVEALSPRPKAFYIWQGLM